MFYINCQHFLFRPALAVTVKTSRKDVPWFRTWNPLADVHDLSIMITAVQIMLRISIVKPTRCTIHSFHLAVCLTTGPKPLPKRALHIVRSRASSFNWEYPLLSLRSSNSFLRLLPCLPVTSIAPCIFPSITRCRKQFLRKMWPIQFAFRLHI